MFSIGPRGACPCVWGKADQGKLNVNIYHHPNVKIKWPLSVDGNCLFSPWGCWHGQGGGSGWREWSLLIVGHESLFVHSDKCCRAPACVHVRVFAFVFKGCETEWSHMTTGHTQSVVARIQHLKHHRGVVPGCSIFQPRHHHSDLASP